MWHRLTGIVLGPRTLALATLVALAPLALPRGVAAAPIPGGSAGGSVESRAAPDVTQRNLYVSDTACEIAGWWGSVW
ncbi:MAG TPA: hypothetical protein VH916_09270, partial [Dehalococcoidia bacterium]